MNAAALEWHDLLHGAAAIALVLAGIPLTIVSLRTHRPGGVPLPSFRYAEVWRVALGILGIAAYAAAIAAVAAVDRSVRVQDDVLPVAAATALLLLAPQALRRGRSAGAATIPAIGLIGIFTLLAVAGPQPAAHDHGAAPPVPQETHHH